MSDFYAIQGHKPDESYIQKNRKTLVVQMKNGGTLLAICLETIFKNASNAPVGPATSSPSASQKPAKDTNRTATGTITLDQAAAHVGETITV